MLQKQANSNAPYDESKAFVFKIISLLYPWDELIRNRTDTPGKTIPPGIYNKGNFLGTFKISADIVV